jgi:hypothetical protein
VLSLYPFCINEIYTSQDYEEFHHAFPLFFAFLKECAFRRKIHFDTNHLHMFLWKPLSYFWLLARFHNAVLFSVSCIKRREKKKIL